MCFFILTLWKLWSSHLMIKWFLSLVYSPKMLIHTIHKNIVSLQCFFVCVLLSLSSMKTLICNTSQELHASMSLRVCTSKWEFSKNVAIKLWNNEEFCHEVVCVYLNRNSVKMHINTLSNNVCFFAICLYPFKCPSSWYLWIKKRYYKKK